MGFRWAYGNSIAQHSSLRAATVIASMTLAFAVLVPCAQAASGSAADALIEMLAAPGVIGHEVAAFSGFDVPELDAITLIKAAPASVPTGSSCSQLVCVTEVGAGTPDLPLTDNLAPLQPGTASPQAALVPTATTGGTEAATSPPAATPSEDNEPPGGATGGAEAPEETPPPLAEPHSHVSSG